MSDIFLSYASEDRELASMFVDTLVQRGWSVWWDREIRIGAQYERNIDEEIRKARCVVVLWSSSSVMSDWVSNEAIEGRERKILVPVKIEETRIPIAFRNIQAASLLSTPIQDQEEFQNFIESIRLILESSHEDTNSETEVQIASESSDKRSHTEPRSGSVAVLVFENLTGRDELAYLCDGIASEIRTNLTRLESLYVVPRSSSIQVEKSDIRKVGQLLDVEKVVEGRFRLFGKELRVDVDVSTTSDGYQTWATSLTLDEKTLTESTQKLVADVRSQFQTSNTVTRNISYTPDPKAFQSFLKGRFYFGAGDTVNRQLAIEHFESAVEIDPKYALAYCGIAEACLLRHIGSNDPSPPSETFKIANLASLTAYELEPGNSTCIGSLGSAYFYDWQWDRAKELLVESLNMDPSNVMVRHSYASLLNRQGKTREASDFLQETLTFDPHSAIAVNGIARLLRYQGRFEEADARCEELLLVMPNSLAAIEELVESAFMALEFDLAEQRIGMEIKELGKDHPTVLWHQVRLAQGRGDDDSTRKYVARLGLVSRTVYVNSSIKAFCRLITGDMDRCFNYLERAIEEKDPWMIDLKLLPLPGFLRSHERFVAILDAIENSPSAIPLKVV